MQSTIEWHPVDDWHMLAQDHEVVFALFVGTRATAVQTGYWDSKFAEWDAQKFRRRDGGVLPFNPTHWAYMPMDDAEMTSASKEPVDFATYLRGLLKRDPELAERVEQARQKLEEESKADTRSNAKE